MSELEDSLALEKKHQSKFERKVKSIKKAKVPVKETAAIKPGGEEERGIIYIGHIPHGFYENEMRKYFSQFGDVRNVRVNRSATTGRSKGYGFVEFDDVDVAKVAAETMNNYLMFKRRLIVEYVPLEKQHKNLFRNDNWSEFRHPVNQNRVKQIAQKNKVWDEKTHLQHCKNYLKKLNKRMEALKMMGITHVFEPVDVPENLDKRLNELNKKVAKKSVAKKEIEVEESDIDEVSETEDSIAEYANDVDESEEERTNFVRIAKKPKEKVQKSLKTITKKKGVSLKKNKIKDGKLKLAAQAALKDSTWMVEKAKVKTKTKTLEKKSKVVKRLKK